MRPLILGYHAVSATWRSRLAVSESVLRSQLELLKRRRYAGLTLTEAERCRAKGTLPARSVVVTFDDGFASTLRAAPILALLGFPATVFVVTDHVDSGEPLAWGGMEKWLAPETREELRGMSWSEVESLAAAGWEIGSHTVTHPVLTTLDKPRLGQELRESKDAVARRFGECTALSYPYGVADATVADEARRSGYEVACTLTFAHMVDEPFRRPRLGVTAADTGLRLALQVSPLGQSARRSRAAGLARALHGRRRWIPQG